MLNKTFNALSDSTRRKILDLLKKEDMPAGQIGKYFNITPPSLSHHLNVLKEANLVSSQRNGREIIYSLNISVFEELTSLMIKFIKKK